VLGHPKQRVLLAVLLVHANDVVSLDRFTAAWAACGLVPDSGTVMASGAVSGTWGGVVGVVVAAGSPLHC
jgi:hypothetical protein